MLKAYADLAPRIRATRHVLIERVTGMKVTKIDNRSYINKETVLSLLKEGPGSA